MLDLAGGELIGFLLICLWLYCIFDVIATDEILVRSLPKMAWLFIVIVLPDIGSIAWLALGRPVFAGWRPGGAGERPVRRVVFDGTPADLVAARSTLTGQHLAAYVGA